MASTIYRVQLNVVITYMCTHTAGGSHRSYVSTILQSSVYRYYTYVMFLKRGL